MAEIILAVLKLAIQVAPWVIKLLENGIKDGTVPAHLADQVKEILPSSTGESEAFVKEHSDAT